MPASHLEENLSAYLAGELDVAETQLVEAHLRECSECAAQLERLRRLNGLLHQLRAVEPSANFLQRFRQKVDVDRRVVVFRSRRTVAWLALAASIVFVVFMLHLKREVQPPPGITHWKPKTETTRSEPTLAVPPPEPTAVEQLTQEEVELIAHLEVLEEMDLIENYDSLENLELALITPAEENFE